MANDAPNNPQWTLSAHPAEESLRAKSECFVEKGGATFPSQPSLGVVGESAPSPAPETTVALVEYIARGEPAARLRAQVAQWHPEATLDQVEDAFQEACLLAVRRARGRSEGEIFTWIRTTTTRKVSEIVAARRREQLAGATVGDLEAGNAGAVDGPPEDELIKREDQADLAQLMAAVLERLSERQRDVVALHTRGRKRPQIAEHLHLSVRTVKRELEQILTVGRLELARFAGHGCAEGEELIRRLAFGLASSAQRDQAQLHLAMCPHCAAFYERLGEWHQKAAAMLPLPAAEHVKPGLLERATHGLGEAASGLKQQLVDGGAQLKQQAASAYYRAVDPTPLSAVRPGAAATAIAGCLALTGGATYCVEQGVSPLDGVGAIVRSAPESKEPQPKPPPTKEPTPTPTPPPAAPPQPQTPVPKPEPRAPAQPAPAQPAPAQPVPPPSQAAPSAPGPQREFDFEQSRPAAPRTPAPAPAQGGGEFF